MKAGAISTAVFALGCAAITWQSAAILGTGFWGWLILGVGVIVGVSPYFRYLRELGRVMALLMSGVAFLAILLGLLAATVGGSFNLPANQAALLFSFGTVGILGFVVSKTLRHK